MSEENRHRYFVTPDPSVSAYFISDGSQIPPIKFIEISESGFRLYRDLGIKQTGFNHQSIKQERAAIIDKNKL